MAKGQSKPVKKGNLGKLTLDVVGNTDHFEKALDRIKTKLEDIVELTGQIVELTETWNAITPGLDERKQMSQLAAKAVSKANRQNQ